MTISIKKAMLVQAICDTSERATYYLDHTTGQILLLPELGGFEELTQVLAPLSVDPQRYQRIAPLPANHFFELVDTFTQQLPPGPIREELQQRDDQPNYFAQFRDTLKQAPAIRQQWQTFYQAQLEQLAQEWLERHHIQAILTE